VIYELDIQTFVYHYYEIQKNRSEKMRGGDYIMQSSRYIPHTRMMKAIEIIDKGDGLAWAGRIRLVGARTPYHNFENKVIVHMNLTPYNNRYMKTGCNGKSM